MVIGGMVNIIQRRWASGKGRQALGKRRPACGIRHRASEKGRSDRNK